MAIECDELSGSVTSIRTNLHDHYGPHTCEYGRHASDRWDEIEVTAKIRWETTAFGAVALALVFWVHLGNDAALPGPSVPGRRRRAPGRDRSARAPTAELADPAGVPGGRGAARPGGHLRRGLRVGLAGPGRDGDPHRLLRPHRPDQPHRHGLRRREVLRRARALPGLGRLGRHRGRDAGRLRGRSGGRASDCSSPGRPGCPRRSRSGRSCWPERWSASWPVPRRGTGTRTDARGNDWA